MDSLALLLWPPPRPPPRVCGKLQRSEAGAGSGAAETDGAVYIDDGAASIDGAADATALAALMRSGHRLRSVACGTGVRA